MTFQDLLGVEGVEARIRERLGQGASVEELVEQLRAWGAELGASAELGPVERRKGLDEIQFWHAALMARQGNAREGIESLAVMRERIDWARFDRTPEFDSIRRHPDLLRLRAETPGEDF